VDSVPFTDPLSASWHCATGTRPCAAGGHLVEALAARRQHGGTASSCIACRQREGNGPSRTRNAADCAWAASTARRQHACGGSRWCARTSAGPTASPYRSEGSVRNFWLTSCSFLPQGVKEEHAHCDSIRGLVGHHPNPHLHTLRRDLHHTSIRGLVGHHPNPIAVVKERGVGGHHPNPIAAIHPFRFMNNTGRYRLVHSEPNHANVTPNPLDHQYRPSALAIICPNDRVCRAVCSSAECSAGDGEYAQPRIAPIKASHVQQPTRCMSAVYGSRSPLHPCVLFGLGANTRASFWKVSAFLPIALCMLSQHREGHSWCINVGGQHACGNMNITITPVGNMVPPPPSIAPPPVPARPVVPGGKAHDNTARAGADILISLFSGVTTPPEAAAVGVLPGPPSSDPPPMMASVLGATPSTPTSTNDALPALPPSAACPPMPSMDPAQAVRAAAVATAALLASAAAVAAPFAAAQFEAQAYEDSKANAKRRIGEVEA
jgi:hypothetical protein